MWSKKGVLCALTGLSLFGIPSGAMTAIHSDLPSTQVTSAWQAPSPHSPVVLAQEDNQQQWREHHYGSDHHDHDRDHHNADWDHHRLDPNDYNWGGRNRYQYTPGWFSPPPSAWAGDRRRAYLKERRQVAINMQRQMLARGDTAAAQRLGAVIGQLNNQLGHR